MAFRGETHGAGLERVVQEAASRVGSVSEDLRAKLRAALWDDMVTEYDARFLVAYLERSPLCFSALFREMLERWEEDEVRHHRSFRRIYEGCFGDPGAELEERRSDFAAIAHLFEGEFEILCLLAYDELATLRGYRGNLPLYDLLGTGLGSFVRRVIGDEARHYAGFRAVLLAEHAHRLGEVSEVVARVRAAEGLPYQATFVLDHDDPVYGDHIFDDAARVLVVQMEKARVRMEAEAGRAEEDWSQDPLQPIG